MAIGLRARGEYIIAVRVCMHSQRPSSARFPAPHFLIAPVVLSTPVSIGTTLAHVSGTHRCQYGNDSSLLADDVS